MQVTPKARTLGYPPPRALNPFKSRLDHLLLPSPNALSTHPHLPPFSRHPHPRRAPAQQRHTRQARAHNTIINAIQVGYTVYLTRLVANPPPPHTPALEPSPSRLEAVQLVKQPLCVVGGIVADNFLRVAHIDLINVLAQLGAIFGLDFLAETLKRQRPSLFTTLCMCSKYT
jgi:hypothetical protein